MCVCVCVCIYMKTCLLAVCHIYIHTYNIRIRMCLCEYILMHVMYCPYVCMHVLYGCRYRYVTSLAADCSARTNSRELARTRANLELYGSHVFAPRVPAGLGFG